MNNTQETKAFFERWVHYHEAATQGSAELYRNIRAVLDGRLAGRVLDVGSGGVITYDVAELEKVIAIDLADVPSKDLADGKVLYALADGRQLSFVDNSFDRVVLQLVIHHLAENTSKETEASVIRCLLEARRVLRPGGRIVIVESCVPGLVEFLEDVVYRWFKLLLKWLGHPMVKQFSVPNLLRMVESAGFESVITKPIKRGKFIIQLGVVVPAIFSPCKIFLIDGAKGS